MVVVKIIIRILLLPVRIWIEIKKIDEINSYRNLITQGGLSNPP